LAENEKAARRQAAALKRSKGMLGKFREGLVEISPVIARALTSPITAAAVAIGGLGYAFTRVIAKASDFDEKIVRSGALATMTWREVKKLSDTVLEASAATEHTATTVSRAAEKLAIAGLELGQIQVALPKVLQLATVGAIDVEESVESLLGIVDQFGLPLSELGRVNDVLAYTSTNMRTTVGQLTEGFAKIGPVAKKYGMTIEDVASALAVMNARQIKGADAGTALRNMITRLIAPLASAKGAIRGITDSLEDNDGKFIGMTALFEKMGEKTDDAALMMEIFQRRTLVAAMASADAADKVRSLTEELKHSGGTAKRIADKQLSTFSGRMKIIRSVIEAIAIKTGNALLPVLTRLANWFLGVLPTVQYFIGKIGMIATIFAQIATAVPQLAAMLWAALNTEVEKGWNELAKVMNMGLSAYNAVRERLGKEPIELFKVASDEDIEQAGKDALSKITKEWAKIREELLDQGLAFNHMAENADTVKTTIEGLVKAMDQLTKTPPIDLSPDKKKDKYDRDKELKDINRHIDKISRMRQKAIDEDADNVEKWNRIKSGIITHYEEKRDKELMDNVRKNTTAVVGLGQAFISSFVSAKTENESLTESMLAGYQAASVALAQEISARLIAYGVEAAAKAMSKEAEKGLVGVATASIAGGLFMSMISGLGAKLLNKGGIITEGRVGVDSVPALLSKGEMVLPKNITDEILNIAGSPGSSMSRSIDGIGMYAKGGIVNQKTGLAVSSAFAPHSHQVPQNPVNMQINTLGLPNRSQARRWLRDTVAPELAALKRSGQVSI